jgi:uncharacterized protein YdiU (UPF0061 family)
VLDAQASLVARWMLVGFIHGVMNTDNMAISGETIDYGPCAFMDAYDPGTVFSSIDHGGRYAYGNQPAVAQWNLARLGETLLPLAAPTPTPRSRRPRRARLLPRALPQRLDRGMRAKLGLAEARAEDPELIDGLLELMRAQRVDFTWACGRCRRPRPATRRTRARCSGEPAAFDAWAERWRARLAAEGGDPAAVAAAMDAVNPVYIARNHLVEEALAAGTAGDLAPFRRLVDVLARPFEERPGLEAYAAPAPSSFGPYRTFCGT